MITINNFGHIDYGRFGNQVFQYALAKVLSLYHNCEFYLNPSDHFLKFFNSDKLTYQKTRKNTKQYDYVESDPYAFDSNIFNINNIDLLGFFQNLYYYKDYLKELRSELMPNVKIIKDTYNYIKSKTKYNINLEDTICIHTRRTDYVQLQNKHGFLNCNYYQNILLQNNLNDNTIFVISDDIHETQNEFKDSFSKYNIHYVTELDAHHDFYIMYLCGINLIANSTFSWWSSVLSDKNNDKRIYAPYPWIKQSESVNTKMTPSQINLYLKSWKKIDYTRPNWDKLFL